MKKVLALSLGDLKNIIRDSILVIVTIVPILVALFARFAVPFLRQVLLPYFDLSSHYAFIMSYLILMSPMMFGMVIGFILLDERDEDILTYVSVTPLTKQGFLVYRIASSMVISFVFCFILLPIAGLTSVDYLKLIPVALLVALEAPMMVLFLGAFAGNKVEGLTLAKGFGIINMAPFAGYFIKSKWQLLAGALPPYWVPKVFVAGYENMGEYWLYVLCGLVVHLAFIWVLTMKFNKRVA